MCDNYVPLCCPDRMQCVRNPSIAAMKVIVDMGATPSNVPTDFDTTPRTILIKFGEQGQRGINYPIQNSYQFRVGSESGYVETYNHLGARSRDERTWSTLHTKEPEMLIFDTLRPVSLAKIIVFVCV